MSACDVANIQSNNVSLRESKKVQNSDTATKKSAKERLLFCKCTC